VLLVCACGMYTTTTYASTYNASTYNASTYNASTYSSTYNASTYNASTYNASTDPTHIYTNIVSYSLTDFRTESRTDFLTDIFLRPRRRGEGPASLSATTIGCAESRLQTTML